MSSPCKPATVAFSLAERSLESMEGFTAHVACVAVDEQFVYATHVLMPNTNGTPPPPLPGHLYIFERVAFGDSGVPPARVRVGNDTRSVAVNPKTGSVYVVNRGLPDPDGQNGCSLSVVRRAAGTGTWAQTAQLKLPLGVADVAVNVARNRVYVSNWGQKRIHVFDGATNKELAPILDPADATSPFRPLGMTVDPATNTLYVALSHQEEPRVDALAVITLANDAVQSIRRVPIAPPRTQPQDVAFNPKTGRLYVSGLGSGGPSVAPPSVTVIDSTSLKVLATIPTAKGVAAPGVSSLAVDAALNKIYVVVAGSVQVIDGATNQISEPSEITEVFQSVAIDRQSGQLYTGDRLDGRVRRLTPVALDTPLGQHWQANPQLGAPLGAPQATPDGQGLLQPFEHGTAVATADWGAVAVAGPHARVWTGAATAGLARAGAASAAAELGNPVGDTKTVAGVPVTYFERGMIATITAAGTPREVVVAGAIWERYRDLGDALSWLGLPSGPEVGAGAGRRQDFARGTIFFRAETGAHAVGYGQIYDSWQARGGVGGAFGFPVGEIGTIRRPDNPQVLLADWCQFEQGALVKQAGVEAVYGLPTDFLRTWLREGGPTGHLGLPISDVRWRQVALPQARWVDFERGVLVQFGAEHPLGLPFNDCHVITSLEFFLKGFRADENDQNNPDNPPDPYIHHFVAARYGDGEPFFKWDGRLPSEDGHWQDVRDIPFEQRFDLADPIRGDLVVDVHFRCREHDTDVDGDDTLGELDFDYTIDTLWGMGEPDEHHSSTEEGEFSAFYVLKQKDIATDLDGNFRDRFFWQFDNFDTARLSPEVYGRTFSDVEPGLQFHINPLEYVREAWEHFFYHAIYKGVGKTGNCFGLCVEALYAYHHRSDLAQPIFQQGHPQEQLSGDLKGDPDPARDAALIKQINIKHGYQLGAPMVRWSARQIVAGKINDGRDVFREAKDAFDRGDWPVLCMVRKWKASGHVVLPIKFVVPDNPADALEIWLADPSRRPAYEDPATPADDRWKILISRVDGRWKYRGSFNSEEPRWLFWVPYSLFKEQPRTPSWEALAVLGALFPPAAGAVNTTFMLLGDAETHQVSDASGRTLYLPGLGRAPETPLDLRSDPGGAIPGVSRVPLLGAEDGPVDGEMHIALGQHLALSHDVVGRAGGAYSWGMRTTGMAAIVTAPSSPTADRISAENLGAAARSMSFQRPAGSVAAKQIALLLEGMPRDRMPRESLTRQFVLDQLNVAAGQRISARVDDGGNEMLVSNQGPTTTFSLQMRGAPNTPLSQGRQLTLEGGKTVRLRPADWSQQGLNGGPVRVEVRNAPDGPAVECFDL